MLAIVVNALYTTLRKRGTTRQLASTIVSSVVCALLLLPARLWYNVRFSAALSELEVGLMLLYVVLSGWVIPLGVTASYCLFTRPRDSSTAGRLPGQRKSTAPTQTVARGAQPPRRQPGVPAPYVLNGDKPWGWLVYRAGNFAGQELALKRAIISIGREEENEVWLDDDTISRYHAELAWDQGQIYLTDNGSLNGILLNGRHIQSSAQINPGDELEIGAHRFVLKLAQQVQEDVSDPLLPQIRRIEQHRSAPGTSSPGLTNGEKQPLKPTAALSHQPEKPDQTDLPNAQPSFFPSHQTGAWKARRPASSPGFGQPPAPSSPVPGLPAAWQVPNPPSPFGLPAHWSTNRPPASSLAPGQPIAWPTPNPPSPSGPPDSWGMPRSAASSPELKPAGDISALETRQIFQKAASQERAPGLCLIRSGSMMGQSFLLERSLLTLGQDAASEIIIPDASIAHTQIQFARRPQGDYVRDQAGLNGSLINGQPLQRPHLLHKGDIITIGEVQLEYTLLPEAQTTSALPTSPTTADIQKNLPFSLRLPSRIKEE